MIRHTLRGGLVALGLLALALPHGAAQAASAVEIDIKSEATLRQFVETVDGAQAFLDASKGVLVFPGVFQIGFILGGQYGEGALRIDGRSVDYYNLAGGSIGFQLGAQSRSIVLVFMEQSALDQFRQSSGWQVGVDGSITLVELGAADTLTSLNSKDPIVAFVFDNKGLMYNLSLEGSKFTRLNKSADTGAAPADSAAAEPAAASPATPAEPEPEPEAAEDDDEIILRRP
jgi:lipid-binding SYLF domain-containing protein